LTLNNVIHYTKSGNCESKGRFFFTKRIDSLFESIRIANRNALVLSRSTAGHALDTVMPRSI